MIYDIIITLTTPRFLAWGAVILGGAAILRATPEQQVLVFKKVQAAMAVERFRDIVWAFCGVLFFGKLPEEVN
ncbi:hypothetical protein MY4824_005904 [Beauveria thailandica]